MNVNVWKAADILVKDHGHKAPEMAIQIIQDYKEKGRPESVQLWQQIYAVLSIGPTVH